MNSINLMENGNMRLVPPKKLNAALRKICELSVSVEDGDREYWLEVARLLRHALSNASEVHATSIINSRGQITVPRIIRAVWNWPPGTQLVWHVMPDGSIFVRAKT